MATANKAVEETVELEEVAAADAKATLSDLLARVGFGGERIIITRHGKRIAALVPVSDVVREEAA